MFDIGDGYGGAFLYTRQPYVRSELYPRLEKAMDKIQVPYKWSDFILTDNTCSPVDNPSIFRAGYAKQLFVTEEQKIQEKLTAFRNAAVNTIIKEEKEALKSIEYLEKEIASFQNELLKGTKK